MARQIIMTMDPIGNLVEVMIMPMMRPIHTFKIISIGTRVATKKVIMTAMNNEEDEDSDDISDEADQQ